MENSSVRRLAVGSATVVVRVVDAVRPEALASADTRTMVEPPSSDLTPSPVRTVRRACGDRDVPLPNRVRRGLSAKPLGSTA